MSAQYSNPLLDEDVRRWYENFVKSILTASVYLGGLGLYCSLIDTTPRKMLQEATGKRFRDDFLDFVRRLEKEGKAGSFISRFKKILLSWLAHNNLSVKLKVNIAGESDTPTIADERIPTMEELTSRLE